MHGEGIRTPRVHHKGRHPLIECAKHDFTIYFIFLFYVFLSFPFLCFFTFLGSTRVLPSLLCILKFDEEIRPT